MEQLPYHAKTPVDHVSRPTALSVIAMIVGSLALALVLVYPHFRNMGYVVSDFHYHFRWAVAFQRSLAQGVLYPRWIPEANYGLGEPTMIYYSPAVFYLTSVIANVLGTSVWTAIRAIELAIYVLVGITAWFLIGKYSVGRVGGWGKAFVLFGVLATQTIPHIAFGSLFVGSPPQHAAAFPVILVLYGIIRQIATGSAKLRPSLLIAVAMSAITLTHILSACILLLCVPFAYIQVPERKIDFRGLGIWLMSATLGLLLSAIYLLPALTSLNFIQSQKWTQYFTWTMGFALPVFTGVIWNSQQRIIPIPTFLMAVLVIVFIWRRRQEGSPRVTAAEPLLMVGLAAIFMSTELSYPIWYFVKPLHILQFGHRFLLLASLCIYLAAVLLGLASIKQGKRLWPAAFAGVMALSMAISFVIAYRALRFGMPIDPAKLTQPSEGAAEYSSNATVPELFGKLRAEPAQQECRRLGITCEVTRSQSQDIEWHVTTASQTTLQLPVFAYPAWRASVDGTPAAWNAAPRTGIVQIAVPPGTHNVRVWWGGLWSERAGAAISALALAATTLLGLQRFTRRSEL